MLPTLSKIKNWLLPWVNRIFALACLVMLIRTLFLSVPAPFALWASTGDLLWQLSLAYSGAWIFNLLVIELPRKRDRSMVYRTSARDVAGIFQAGNYLVKSIFESAGKELPASFSERALHFAMIETKFTDPHPNMVAPIGAGAQTRAAIWAEAIPQFVRDVDTAISRLQPVYHYYEAEAIERIEQITKTWIFGIVHDGHMHRWAESSDFQSLESGVQEIWWNSLRLEQYYDKNLSTYVSSVPNMRSRFPGRSDMTPH